MSVTRLETRARIREQDQRMRLAEKPHELTPSQEQSGVIAGWCFIGLLLWVGFAGLVGVVAWALGL